MQPTQPKSGMTRVVSRCQKCSIIDEFDISTAGLAARAKGVKPRVAFPDLSEERIQQLCRHICPNCQKLENEAKG